MNALEIYARGMVGIRGFEQALKDGIALAEEEGDKALAGQLRGLLSEAEAMHRRAHRTVERRVGDVSIQIGGGK